MNVHWSIARCILCGSGEDITTEHITPACLAGKLVADFLCKDCNSRFGHDAESDVRNDPKVRQLIERLVRKQPHLADKLRKRLPYMGHSEQGEISGYMRDGRFVPKEQRLDDGSLIVPEDRSLCHVENIAGREGRGPLRVTPDQLRCLPSGGSVKVASGLFVTNWTLDSIRPDLSGPKIDPIVPAKIAFEFLALHCGSKVYENPPQLSSIRRQLIDGRLSGDEIRVQRLEAQNGRLFHGLIFEGNSPGARVQIRLFGSLAFRVEFSRWSISGTRCGYTHDLESGDDGDWVAA